MDLVLTAAHCVYDAGSRRQDLAFVFVPGMEGSVEPLGSWKGTSATYWSGYATMPAVSLDYAFVDLDPNAQGQQVGDVTGFHKILEYARPHRILSEGYPGSGPFARRCTIGACRATYCYSPLGAVYPGAYSWDLGMGCITGHGSSGGPWFVRFHRQEVIGSITSVGLRAQHGSYFRDIWGPQFDSRLETLLRAAENR